MRKPRDMQSARRMHMTVAMALNPKLTVTLTVEEIEDIKETARSAGAARVEEMEWQLRLELAKLREVERNLSKLLGESSMVSAPVSAPVAARPAPAVPAPSTMGRGTPSNGTPAAAPRRPAMPPPLPPNARRLRG
jgi:hypothetical protein